MEDGKLKIEYRPIDSLVMYARNPRKNDTEIDKMVAVIKEFGFRLPILIKSDGTVIDGHLRIKAAKRLDMKELPCILADGMSDAQVKAFRLLANRSVSWAEWDEDLLRLEFQDLKAAKYDLNMTGFDTSEVDKIYATLESLEEIEENDIDIKPFKKTHILLSFKPELLSEIQDYLNGILKVEGVEYEQASN